VLRRPKWLHWRRGYVRRLWSGLFAGLILAGPIVGIVYLWANWPARGTDQLAAVGVVATVVTVWLAGIAAIVALLAYLLADESPDLAILINGAAPADGLEILLGNHLSQGRHEIVAPPQITFKLENSSKFSARNPVVELAFTDFYVQGFDARWQVFRQTADDISLQWSGGADISVHGQGRFLLPSLSLGATGSWARLEMTLTVEVFADGFHLKPQRVPVSTQVISHP